MIDLKYTVVKIKSGTEIGTGFIVDKQNGFILTCAHVIKTKADIKVYCFNSVTNSFNQKLVASLHKEDKVNDIALLKVQQPLPNSLVELPLHSCQNSQGQAFKTYGFSHTDGYPTEGYILSIDNPFNGVRRIILKNAKTIQQGASGGPVLDISQGGIVGIVRGIASSESAYVGDAYGIPMDYITQLIPEVQITSRALQNLTSQQNHGKRLLKSFKQIKVQYEVKKYTEYDTTVRTFLVNVPKQSKIDTTWFWSISLLKGKPFEYVKAGSNHIGGIEHLLGGLLGLDEYNVSTTSGELDQGKLQIFAHLLIKKLATKDVYLVIDNAVSLIEKNTVSHNINFLTQIWQPISQAVENAAPKHHLCLLLVQNKFAANNSHHHYATEVTQSVSNKTPLLLEYWGFQHTKETHKPTDQANLRKWVENFFAPNFGMLEDIKNEQGISFFELYKTCSQDYEQACACGNIEKLFDKICTEFGYTFIKNNPTKGNTTLWEVIPTKKDLPSLANV